MKVLILTTALIAPHLHASHFHKLDPEMTGREYLRLLSQVPQGKVPKGKKGLNAEDLEIEKYLEIGKRNLQWVDYVNSKRDPGQRLSLSSQATQAGNPVSNPRTYNFRTIKDKWSIVLALMPKPLKKVLVENGSFTTDLGVTDREFTEWLFQVDGAYQITARYKMMKPWKEEMKAGAAADVRGFVSLKAEEDLDQKLAGWDSLPKLTKSRLSRDLTMVCLNSQKDRDTCSEELSGAMKDGNLLAFKDQYMGHGQAVYDGFFRILGSRPDGMWTSADENNMVIPFANPHNDAVLKFLKVNIEDEWRWNGWQLRLDFVESDSPDMTHVVFEPGATPHVESAPGSVITMDQNAPLSEYDVQWTIRHEYGHVLGFPDCYHEFYDEEQEAFVSYQLDVTNLMCSRRGRLQQTHYDELKKAYFKP